MTWSVSIDDGRVLVRRARQIVENHLSNGKVPKPVSRSPRLLEKAGVFVTLLRDGEQRELRGCVGTPYPDNSLLDQLDRVAVEAATMDPRFAPVELSEFKNEIIVEVTVLSPPELMKATSPLGYREMVRVGTDGIIVDGMGSRGLLLPQVAVEEGFDSEELLSQCCMKAGLLPDAWLSGRVQISRFQGQVFGEDKPGGKVSERFVTIPK